MCDVFWRVCGLVRLFFCSCCCFKEIWGKMFVFFLDIVLREVIVEEIVELIERSRLEKFCRFEVYAVGLFVVIVGRGFGRSW